MNDIKESYKNGTIEDSLEDFINDPKNNPKNQPRYFFSQAKSYYEALCELFRIVKNLHLENVLRKKDTAPVQKIINGIDEENNQIEYKLGEGLSIEGETSPYIIKASGGSEIKKATIYTNLDPYNPFTNTEQIPVTLPTGITSNNILFLSVRYTSYIISSTYTVHNVIVTPNDNDTFLSHKHYESGASGITYHEDVRSITNNMGSNPFIKFGPGMHSTYSGVGTEIHNSYIIPIKVDIYYM